MATSTDAVVITCARGDAVSRAHVLAQAAAASTTAALQPVPFYVNLLAMDVIARLGNEDDVSSALGPVAALKSALCATVEWHPFRIHSSLRRP